jgi:hypothetical protein
MNTKLTLRIDRNLIGKAKKLARKRGKSLSRLVSEYLKFATSKEFSEDISLPPNVKGFYGSLSKSTVAEEDYKEYIENKHL